MSFIIVNEKERTSGDVDVVQRLEVQEDGTKRIVYEGVLICDKYFEEIDTIKSENLLIEGVYVFQEVFSSKTANIQYVFAADKFTYTGGTINE